jgi:hypothetical protein
MGMEITDHQIFQKGALLRHVQPYHDDGLLPVLQVGSILRKGCKYCGGNQFYINPGDEL